MIDFSAMAPRYDRLRPGGDAWQQVADQTLKLLGGSTRILDVGCGTGRFAVLAASRLGGRVWGVDPSEAMLAEARARPGGRSVGWKLGRAEDLPFRSGWFDAVHAHLVLHLLAEPERAYAELARVLTSGGRAVLVSFRPEHFDGFYLNAYFPSIPQLDAARFPSPAEIVAGLADAGFGAPSVESLSQQLELDPADVVGRVRGRYISTLHLLDEREYADGLARLERDLSDRSEPLHARLEWCLVRADRV